MESHYQVLGVGPQAGRDEVKRAYRALVMRCHPDKFRGTATEEAAAGDMFRRVSQAWEVLSDDAARTAYDASLRRAGEADDAARVVSVDVDADDMEEADNGEWMQYPCRCGAYYRMTTDDWVALDAGGVIVNCSSCSLRARVSASDEADDDA